MLYLNHLDQSLPEFNLNIIIELSFPCFLGVTWNCREDQHENGATLKNNLCNNHVYPGPILGVSCITIRVA